MRERILTYVENNNRVESFAVKWQDGLVFINRAASDDYTVGPLDMMQARFVRDCLDVAIFDYDNQG